jgi:hypothetical protein
MNIERIKIHRERDLFSLLKSHCINGSAVVSEILEEAKSNRDWDVYFELLSSHVPLNSTSPRHERLRQLKIQRNLLTDEEYWRQVGKACLYNGCSSENDGLYRELLLSKRTKREKIMLLSERKTLKSLASKINVYRGFNHPSLANGWSWSLKEDVAKHYSLNDTCGLITQGLCLKKNVIAYFENGNSYENTQEILIPPEHVNIISWRNSFSDEVKDGKQIWHPRRTLPKAEEE